MIKGLSLFSSAGVGETYIHNHIIVANELLEDRARFYSHFSPHTTMIQGDITDPLIFRRIENECHSKEVNFIIATPPCQSFSKAGLMKINDERSYLFMYVLHMIQSIKPKYVLIENVVEFMSATIMYENNMVSVQDIINRNTDYVIDYNIINAKDYDTPQDRKRCIILFSRKDQQQWQIPPRMGIITVEQTIGHLPSLQNNERSDIKWHYSKAHNDRHVLWMTHTPTGKTAFDNPVHFPQKDGRRIKGFKTTYKRIKWDAPAPTITMANGSISSQNNVHPGRLVNGLYSDPRVLSVLEVMLLTGLPYDWDIPVWASESLLRKVLGECVQPKLIYHFIKQLTIS